MGKAKTIPSRKRKERTDQRLLAEIEAGKLDERTKPAIAMRKTRAALEEDQQAASMELLRRDISVNVLLQDIITARIANDSSSMFDPKTGRLDSSVMNDLLKLQEQNRRALVALNQIKGKSGGGDAASNAKAVLEVE